jgi:hypothetical protein
MKKQKKWYSFAEVFTTEKDFKWYILCLMKEFRRCYPPVEDNF